ncbi:putative metallopeptidase [Ophiocordyceps camponoti-floridani]|uniref:Putative metallopeptidase n=1 Tax=Ophiocordyceps camponoti-floridani TaxID=2030778 RepID=A0A8H4Q827_9HYPO|nr:putative metallopeptidase [Ophiocordyceps camponoti-floridani]
MERTESGLSISSTTSPRDALSSLALDDNDDIATGRVLSDLEAAHLVHAHLTAFRRRCPDSQSERILRALITPKSRAADFPLDNDALRSIFSASNELFFASRLACRVAWDWSHPACGQYESHIVGTTALRRCARLGGWETLIVLSSPILRDTKYNRRLLISTFLHEMIHSFMFVTCGLKASHDGGHTDGFRHIAAMIDDWAGKEYLRLTDMEADLERFRGDHDGHCQDEGRLCPEYSPPIVLDSRDWLPYADNGNSKHHYSHDNHDNHHQHQHHQHHNHHHHHHHHHLRNHLHHYDHYSHDAAALPPVTYSHHASVAAHGGWQWCEQENFGHHSPYPTSSPYVY